MSKVKVLPPKRRIEGVKPQVAEAVAKMLEGGRRYFGSSGAGLTHVVGNPKYPLPEGFDKSSAKIGLEAERETTEILKTWMKDKPNAVLVDSVHVRGWGKEEIDEETGLIEGGDTDHIMIIGSEVILIDTKRWRKKSNYQVDDDGSILRTKKPFPGGKVKMEKAMYMWLDYLDADARITPIIFINSPETSVFRNRNWYTHKFRIVEFDRFQEMLDSKYEKISDFDKTTINSTLVSQVVVGAIKPFDVYERVFDMKKLKGFR